MTDAFITVDLPAAAAGPGPAVSVSNDACELAVQQLVYTLTAATDSNRPVEILVDGRRGEQVWCTTAGEIFLRNVSGDVLQST